VNVELKKEADFFSDIVIVPYMDNYDLVVLKTVAICEYGVSNEMPETAAFSFINSHRIQFLIISLCLQVRTVAAKYIMKCDDDTFVRVDAVLKEANNVPQSRSLYVGNINYYHKPLRTGKWAVTYEVLLGLCFTLPLISRLLRCLLGVFACTSCSY